MSLVLAVPSWSPSRRAQRLGVMLAGSPCAGSSRASRRPMGCPEARGREAESGSRNRSLRGSGGRWDGSGRGAGAVASPGEGPAPGAAAGPPRRQVSEGGGSRSGGARGLARSGPGASGAHGAGGVLGRGCGGASSGGGGDGQPPSVLQLRPLPPSRATRVAPAETGGVGEGGLLGLEGPGSRARR